MEFKRDSDYRVSDPETVKSFMENHVWLDIQDDMLHRIEWLRLDLENNIWRNDDGTTRECKLEDAACLRGQIRAIREMMGQPSVILGHLLAGPEEQTEEEMNDDN